MNRDRGDDQRDAEALPRARDLREHDDPDHGRGRRQQRHHQRVGGAGQPDIASWSHTYGITDEVTPTPIPAAIATGSSTCGTTAQPPIAVLTGAAISIAAPSPSMPPTPARATRGARARCTARTGPRCRRERDSEGLTRHLHRDQAVHPGHREREREPVADRANADRREHDHRQELDRGHGSERQSRDRLVEAAVHHREHAPSATTSHTVVVGRSERAPRPAPDREHDRCAARSAATRPRAAPPARTAAPRTPARDSGTPRCRRSTPAAGSCSCAWPACTPRFPSQRPEWT